MNNNNFIPNFTHEFIPNFTHEFIPNFTHEFISRPFIPNIYNYDNLYYKHIMKWSSKKTPDKYYNINMHDFLQELLIKDDICKHMRMLNIQINKICLWINTSHYILLHNYIKQLLHTSNILYNNINKNIIISRFIYCQYILTIRTIRNIIMYIEPSYFIYK